MKITMKSRRFGFQAPAKITFKKHSVIAPANHSGATDFLLLLPSQISVKLQMPVEGNGQTCNETSTWLQLGRAC